MKISISNPLNIDLFEAVLFLIEYSPYIIATFAAFLLYHFLHVLPTTSKSSITEKKKTTTTRRSKFYYALLIPTLIICIIASVATSSWEDAYKRGYQIFKLPSLRTKLETYIETGNDDLHSILESNMYAPTFGWIELRYLLKDLLRHTVFHTNDHNEDNIDEGYNKGNDWFKATLGETMMYTSGLYPTGDETLTEAQNYKIDYVADAIQLEEGMSVLDIGCGWTYMTNRLTEKYGANVTGVTLSKEQLTYGKELNKDNDAKLFLQDAMRLKGERTDLIPEGGFDRITSLEMAEHVGIRRYQEFLSIVHGMMKDDGVFYFQVAGLRRAWRFEDFIWGLFMGECVFPGADASCPLGWVTSQVERAGFEIQRVHNMGSHYSRTLAHWLENWRSNEYYIVDKYGAQAYRRWEVFLAWSVRAARQGSSTLFMLTLTKAGVEDRRIKSQAHLVPKDVQA